LPYAFGLQQMPALMLGDDFQTRPDRESKHRYERILKSNAIDVVFTRPADKFSRFPIASKKQLKNGLFYLLARYDFRGRLSPLGP